MAEKKEDTEEDIDFGYWESAILDDKPSSTTIKSQPAPVSSTTQEVDLLWPTLIQSLILWFNIYTAITQYKTELLIFITPIVYVTTSIHIVTSLPGDEGNTAWYPTGMKFTTSIQVKWWLVIIHNLYDLNLLSVETLLPWLPAMETH